MNTRAVHVSLGDSLASGEGVGVQTPPHRTWPGLLAAAAGARFVPLAHSGVPVATVIRDQLPAARALEPDTAYICVGLNDLFRTGGAKDRAHVGVRTLVRRLRADGTTVVAGRLHDPTHQFRFPPRMGRLIRGHVAGINECLDELAADPGLVLLDMSVLVDRCECWAVDRLHPSGFGHRVLAAHAAEHLGVTVSAGRAPRAPSTAAWWVWLARHGAPWLARRLPELATSEPLRRHVRIVARGPRGCVHSSG